MARVDEPAGLVGTLAGAAGELRGGSRYLSASGGTFDAFGYVTSITRIGSDLHDGNYWDAGFESVSTGMEGTADVVVARGGPVAYLTAVNLRIWADVGREARNVDWSPEGLRQIQDASLSEWGSALGSAVSELPGRLPGYLTWW
jgi:hypothetical protein